MQKPIDESYWVKEGLFLAGEYPGSLFEHGMRKKLSALLEAGIQTFIDLTDDGLKPYEQLLTRLATTSGRKPVYYRMPIEDVSVPVSPGYLKSILDTIDESLAAGRPVYVHCRGGVGRTGLVVGCWLVRHGRSGEEALSFIAEHWKTVPKSRRLPNSPETFEQRRWVLNWNEA